jgi:hypothetical protein
VDDPDAFGHGPVDGCALEEEVVRAFEQETDPRERLGPASRLLEVLKEGTLKATLAKRLIPLARTGPDLRFLAHRVPSRALGAAVRKRALGGPHEAA